VGEEMKVHALGLPKGISLGYGHAMDMLWMSWLSIRAKCSFKRQK